MVAGFFDEVVEACAFAAEDEDGVGGEVVVGVVGGSALVESDDPNVGFLHLLEGADEVGDAGDADVFGGSGGGLGDGGGDGGGAALGEEDAVDSGAVGSADECSEVVRVFEAVKSEEEARVVRQGQEVFEGEELAFADHGEDALVGVGAGEAGELVAGFEGDTDFGGPGEGDDGLKAGVRLSVGSVTFPSYRDVVKLAGAGADGLLDGMEAVENFHFFSLRGKNGEKWAVGL